jgi:hypothetical protein
MDTYPLSDPDRADLIDGTIGELSPFHEQFGYYAHGVGPETAILPENWRNRWVPVCNENTHGVTGYCLSPEDLAISKLAARRDRGIHFVELLLQHNLCTHEHMRGTTSPHPLLGSSGVRLSQNVSASSSLNRLTSKNTGHCSPWFRPSSRPTP